MATASAITNVFVSCVPGATPSIARPPALNPDEVVTKVIQVLLDSCLSCFADRYDTDNSCNPDGDPKDG